MIDHLTGVNVTTSGLVATPVGSNDGSERATLRAETCQRRAQQSVCPGTAGRTAGTTVSTDPGTTLSETPADRDRGGGLRSVRRVQSFRTPHEMADGPGGCARGVLHAADRGQGASQFRDLSFASAPKAQGSASGEAPSDRDRG